ncbi:coiled-coil domain-containing protein 110-like [Carettochelys insculpta]|uniref:coiled-coil domain-containing protein 110-like n=1 Tax=Carettochelys insculpta TaxID=44489 RepID=UPI003EBB4415
MRHCDGYRKEFAESSGGSKGQETDPLPVSKAPGSCEEAGSDNYTTGTGGQIQPQSALNILQQQLKSFQALRQQTLLNVNMVQSEISEILNKYIIDTKTPQCTPDKLLMTSTSLNMAMTTESPERPLSKKKFHCDKLCTTQSVETNSNNIFGNVVNDVNISHQFSFRATATGKISNSVEPIENKTMVALSNNCKLKDSDKYECVLSTDLEAESMVHPTEKVILDDSEAHTPLLKYNDELHLTDNFNDSIRPLKQELQKSHKQKLAYAFKNQNVSCSQSNVSDMSEKDLEKSAFILCGEKLHLDLKSSEIAEPEESADNNLRLGREFNKDSECDNSQNSMYRATCSIQRETESKNKNKDLHRSNTGVDTIQLNVCSTAMKDKLFMPDGTEKLQKEKEQQLHIKNQRLLKLGNQNFYEVRPDEYTTKMEELQNSLKDSKHLQNLLS